jgi:hypothetical protein
MAALNELHRFRCPCVVPNYTIFFIIPLEAHRIVEVGRTDSQIFALGPCIRMRLDGDLALIKL